MHRRFHAVPPSCCRLIWRRQTAATSIGRCCQGCGVWCTPQQQMWWVAAFGRTSICSMPISPRRCHRSLALHAKRNVAHTLLVPLTPQRPLTAEVPLSPLHVNGIYQRFSSPEAGIVQNIIDFSSPLGLQTARFVVRGSSQFY